MTVEGRTYHASQGPSDPHFCPECGAELEPGAHFCAQCGHSLVQARPAAAPPMPVPAPARGRGPWIAILITAVVLAAAGVAVALILSGGGGDESDYRADLADTIEPMAQANDELSAQLDTLAEGDDPAAAQAAARAARSDLRSVRLAVGRLEAPADERALERAVSAALRTESDYLAAVTEALRAKTTAAAEAANTAAKRARTAWRRAAREIPGAGGEIAGLDALVAWAAGEPTAERQTPQQQPPQKQPEQKPQATVDCGGFQGIVKVLAKGVGCQEAMQVAAAVVNGSTGANGFSCSAGEPDPDGIVGAYCKRSDGATVEFGFIPE